MTVKELLELLIESFVIVLVLGALVWFVFTIVSFFWFSYPLTASVAIWGKASMLVFVVIGWLTFLHCIIFGGFNA